MTAVQDPLRRLSPVVRLAPAKLNLTLAVVGRREDGYHSLHSVFVPLTLADRISLAPLGGDRDTLHVTGLDAGPPADNLVLRALAAARAAVGGGWAGGPGPAPALAARLDKRIPVAAGLAGGSSDAAATLDGALEAWGAELDEHARHVVAAHLGSDVPFFLAGGPALVEGRGEQVAPLHGLHGAPGVVLVTPLIAVSTPDVFAAFDAIRTHGDGAVRMSSTHLAEELRSGLTADNLVARAGVLASANDLLPATSLVVPALVPFKRALSRLLGRPIGLSGSGPTLWALYPSETDAAAAADVIREALADGRLDPPGSGDPFVVASCHRQPQPGGKRSMTRRAVSTAGAPAAIGPYSQGIVADGFLFSAGQAALDPLTADLVQGGIEPETERVMANLSAVLDAAGASWGDVVKTTIFLVDMADFAVVNGIYGRFVTDPPPARSTVGVAALPKGARVEIEVVARVG